MADKEKISDRPGKTSDTDSRSDLGSGSKHPEQSEAEEEEERTLKDRAAEEPTVSKRDQPSEHEEEPPFAAS
jgi:hypothetical protein